MPDIPSPEELRCSFCGRKGRELGDDKLLNGQGNEAFICSHCVEAASDILKVTKKKKRPLDLHIPKPTEIKSYLDAYIIGQEAAKVALSVAVCDHYKRVSHNAENDSKKSVHLEKSNVLMIGPTGTGKTQFARSIAEYLGVPFAVGDATTLTEAGYVGDDVENLLLRLIQAADGDIESAQNGILFVDEIDKIASTASSRSTSKDVGGEGVQQALLKLFEGTISHVSPKGGRKHPEGSVIPFDTANVLFICSGAFVGLEEVLEERIFKTGTVGFSINEESTQKEEKIEVNNNNVKPEDLIKYGLIPELVGRVPVITCLHELDEEALRKIFVDIKDSLYQQYRLQFKLDGVELEITEEAIQEIIRESIKLKTGARGLRAVAERMILPYKYCIEDYIEDGHCTVTGRLINGDFGQTSQTNVEAS